MSNGFEQYDDPIGPTPGGPPMGPTSPGSGGGILPSLAIAGLSAIGAYLSAKSQERSAERGWKHQLELERMRIEAEKELDRERRTLDPAIYAMLKKELLKPRAPHGMGAGAGRPQTGAFREMLEPQRVKPRPTPTGGGIPSRPPQGGGQGFDMNRYLTGGGR